jgi:hypothetical protein
MSQRSYEQMDKVKKAVAKVFHGWFWLVDLDAK